jgi:hypothetical protein
MTGRSQRELTLSVFLSAKGYAFTVFKGPVAAIDWGTKEVVGRGKNDRCFEGVVRLIDRYRPDALVIEEWWARRAVRVERICRLYRRIDHHARKHSVPVHRYRRREVIACFERLGARTKHERAVCVADHIPAFTYRVPPKRKLWKSDHPRMAVFEAAALNMTHFAGGRQEHP